MRVTRVIGWSVVCGAIFMAGWGTISAAAPATSDTLPFAIVDTGQVTHFDTRRPIAQPPAGAPFAGQDAAHTGNAPAYRDNGDGTVSDLVTGLMWTQDPGAKMTHARAVEAAKACRVGGHADWRLPSIKALYSLILFSGVDVDPRATSANNLQPFIDNKTFAFRYGDPSRRERIIDSQFATSTINVSKIMRDQTGMFGVNFADGRIKCYPIGATRGRGEKLYYALFVRGNPLYGQNDFHDNGDGTVTDRASGLIWQKADSGKGMTWQQALAYAEGLELAGHDDWRLPNAKELQSIVDYSRAPDKTDSAAIDPVFAITAIQDKRGRQDYPFFWTGTTHKNARGGSTACYVAFGRAGGWMSGRRSLQKELLDVHGAGAQRSDPKVGNPNAYPYGRGPQGDVIRIYNFVRCVRGPEPR